MPVNIPPVIEKSCEDEAIIKFFEKKFKAAEEIPKKGAQAKLSKKPSKKSPKKKAPTPPIIQVPIVKPANVPATTLVDAPAEEIAYEVLTVAVPVAQSIKEVIKMDSIQPNVDKDDSDHASLTRLASKAQKRKQPKTTSQQVEQGLEPP
nr:hypothetical protein Itr_chr07CG06720 [Ipomoea trifida]